MLPMWHDIYNTWFELSKVLKKKKKKNRKRKKIEFFYLVCHLKYEKNVIMLIWHGPTPPTFKVL